MTVKEIIESFKCYPEDSEVYIDEGRAYGRYKIHNTYLEDGKVFIREDFEMLLEDYS